MSIIEKLGITPGPWFNKGKHDITCNDKYVIPYPDGSRMTIATIWDDKMFSIGTEEGNKRLIITAPEILEALIENIVIYCETFGDFEECEHIQKQILAVEKATGMTWQEIKGVIHD